MKKKFLAVLLTLLMLLGALAMTTAADGGNVAEVNGTQYATLQEAVNAANPGETVTLLADTSEDVTINKSITLNLGGNTLTNKSAGKATISVTGGTVTVKSGTVQGGTSYYNIEVTEGSNANLTLEGVTATAGNTGSSMIDNWGTMTITSGTYSGGLNVVKSEEGSTLTINGGTFTRSYAPRFGITGTIMVYGTTTITGGTFIDESSSTNARVIATGKVAGYDSITYVTGGAFTGNGRNIFHGMSPATSDNFEVSGGTFDKSVSDGFFKDGYFAKKVGSVYTADGPYAAKIGSTGYNTLAAAVEAVANNGTITLLQDIRSDRINLETKSFTVSLNGHTLTSTAAYGVMFCAKNGNTITVKGDKYSKLVGTLMVTSGTDGHIAISGGTYENPKYCPIYINGAVNSENSTLTVKNATITASGTDSDQDTGCAVYLAGYCTSTFKDTTITAPVTGIEIRAGKLTLENCTVTGGNGTVTTNANGNGTTVKNAALAISQHTTKKPIDVTITGGKYTATAALYQTDVQGTGSAGVNATVNSGKFNGTVSAETNNTVAVKGGTFTNAVPENCCADGYIPTTNAGGTYGVKVSPPVEVWTGYSLDSSKSRVACYETLAEAIENLNGNKWILIAKDYTLSENFTIPTDVRVDVKSGATLTVAEGATLTVAADAKRLAVLTGGSIVNNGTIMVCGTSYSTGKVMIDGTLTGKLSVPEGYFLDNNGNNYFATENSKALYEVTYSDGSIVKSSGMPSLDGATKLTLLRHVADYAGSISGRVADGFIFDLGGYTLTGKATATTGSVLNISAPVTIQNGTIKFTGEKSDKIGALQINGADVTIAENVTIDGGKSYAIWPEGYGHTLTVNGTVTSNGDYAIAGFGDVSGGYIDDCSITVNAGAVISAPNGVAIYHPELGTVTINGGEITGHTGIEMCAGKLVVKDGTITSTGADDSNSDNVVLNGAAISILDRSYPGGSPSAEITGGTFTSATAPAIRAYHWEYPNATDWTDAGTKVNISGGTFSSIPDNMSTLCAAGYIAVKNADGTYTVMQDAPTTYAVAVADTEHGAVTVRPRYAERGRTVTVTVTPDDGYVLETLTVTDKNGNAVELTDKGSGKYTFKMPGRRVEIKATFMEDNSVLNFFVDVPNDAYYYEAVKWAVENGITQGRTETTFCPEDTCTRAEIVTFLWRAFGSPEVTSAVSYTDVDTDAYYAVAVAWAVENGITVGTSDTTFSPDDTCTRAQAVTFLCRAAGLPEAASALRFTDVAESDYFAGPVKWAVENGVTVGTSDTTFSPEDTCTRAQIVTFLFRLYAEK